jgi:SAM-dependent methyltransferase
VDQWLSLIDRYGPKQGVVIEAGCAPGVLLQELDTRGYDCIGVEISEDVVAWLKTETHLDIRAGAFPGIELPPCDLFLSFDVWEHSNDPPAFLEAVSRLLKPGAIAIIQTAVDRYDYVPPFGERQDMFDDLEHLFLFTDRAVTAMAKAADLEVVSLEERLWLAGEVCVFRK